MDLECAGRAEGDAVVLHRMFDDVCLIVRIESVVFGNNLYRARDTLVVLRDKSGAAVYICSAAFPLSHPRYRYRILFQCRKDRDDSGRFLRGCYGDHVRRLWEYIVSLCRNIHCGYYHNKFYEKSTKDQLKIWHT